MKRTFHILLALVFCLPTLLRAQGKLEDFTFNPLSVKRDPFTPPAIETKGNENELIKFDLLEMKLVAIMTGLGTPKAMLVLPSGSSHIIQEGDQLGKNRGYVSKILSKEITVVESFKDFRGRTKKNYEKLTID